MWQSVFLLCVIVGASAADQAATPPAVRRLRALCKVRSRVASVTVEGRLQNDENHALEFAFSVRLPPGAYTTGFRLLAERDPGGHPLETCGLQRDSAQSSYFLAKLDGGTTALVQTSDNDSSIVRASVNVEPQRTMAFELSYEQRLDREEGAYQTSIEVLPEQVVDELMLEVEVNETLDISRLDVGSEENSDADDTISSPVVEQSSSKAASVRWSLTKSQQERMASGQRTPRLVLRYDVDREEVGGQVLLDEDGHMVHALVPEGEQPVPGHVVLVVDLGAYTAGNRERAMRSALSAFLDQLTSNDTFSIVLFSGIIEVWQPNVTAFHLNPYVPDPKEELPFDSSAIVPATDDNVAKAKQLLQDVKAGGGVNVVGALLRALDVADAWAAQAEADRRRDPIVLFFTTGQPTDGLATSPDEIIRLVAERNSRTGARIFSVAAQWRNEFVLPKRIALVNGGFGRLVYETADGGMQVRHLYREIASPSMVNSSYVYDDQQSADRDLFAASPGERRWNYLRVKQLSDDINYADNFSAQLLSRKYLFVNRVNSLLTLRVVDSKEAEESLYEFDNRFRVRRVGKCA